MQTVEDKSVVVTGGGSGIGEAMCHLMANNGAKVIVADIKLEAAEKIAQEISNKGAIAQAVKVDIADPDSIASLVSATERYYEGCQLLIANAGVLQLGRLDTRQLPDWQWVFSVNLFGTVECVQQFLPLLRRNSSDSHIVLTGSMAGLLASAPGKGVYNASKHALMSYGETLRDELAEEGIGVTLFLPGGTQSNITMSHETRPKHMGAGTAMTEKDIKTVVASTGDSSESMVTAEHSIRDLLHGIYQNHRWVIPGSPQREKIEARFKELKATFDRAT